MVTNYINGFLPLALLSLMVGYTNMVSSGQDSESVSLGRIADWELSYIAPTAENGGACLATKFSGDTLHVLGLGSSEGVWLWDILQIGATGIEAGSSHNLTLEFDKKSKHTIEVIAISETTLRKMEVDPQIINDLARYNRVLLSWGGHQKDSLELKGTRKLIDTLKDCHHNKILAESAFSTNKPEKSDQIIKMNQEVAELIAQGDNELSIELAKETVKIAQQLFGVNRPETALSLSNLARGYHSLGRNADAEPFYKQSLAIAEENLDPDHPYLGMVFNNIAMFYQSQSLYTEAEQLYKRSIGILEKAHGPEAPNVALTLNNLAELYRTQGRYTEAEPLFKRSLDLLEKAHGTKHTNVGLVINNLAELYSSQGRYNEAEPLYNRSLAITEEALGPDHIDVATSLNNLASFYHRQGRYAEAESLYNKSLKLRERALGSEHLDVAISLNNLAHLHDSLGQFSSAEPLYYRSLAIIEKVLGTQNPDFATSLNNLAALYHNQGRYTEAELFYERSLAIREKALGQEHPDVALALSNLAEIYSELGRFSDAELLHNKSLSIYEKALGSEHPDVATSLNNLAHLYSTQGLYSKAEVFYQKSMDLREKSLGLDHPDIAASLNNLAENYRSQGRYIEAELLTKKSLAIQERQLGSEHPDIALALSNLALICSDLGRYSEAELLYKKSLAIKEKVLGLEHPDMANILNNLAAVYVEQHRHDEAQSLFERSLSIREKSLGAEHPDVALVLSNLAEFYNLQGRDAEAESLFIKALGLLEKSLGSTHPYVATTLNNLAGLYMRRGQYANAEPLYERARSVLEKAVGAFHPKIALHLNNLAELYRVQGNYGKAKEFFDRSLELWEETLGLDHPNVALSLNNLAWLYKIQNMPDMEHPLHRRVLSIHTSRYKNGVMGRYGEGSPTQRIHSFPYLHLLSRLASPDTADRADALTAVQLARRPESGEAFRLLAQRLAAGGSGELAALVRERQDLLQQMEALEKKLIETYASPEDKRPEGLVDRLREQVELIQERERTLSERLQREFPRYAEFEGTRLADLEALQQALNPSEAALAWVLGTEESYLLIVPDEGDLRLKALPVTEGEVADQVKKLHSVLDLADPAHYGELASFPAALAAKLFEQLFGHDWQTDLKGINQLVLVPEGPLTRLAFPVLLTEAPAQDEYPASSANYASAPWLIRRFGVSVLPSLSALTALRGEVVKGQAPQPFLGVGDPLLDDHPAKTRDGEQPLDAQPPLVRNVRSGGQVQPPPASPEEMRSVRLARIRSHPSLPDTADELQRVAKLLGADDQALLLRGAATEQRVKQTVLTQYGIISFATHGVLAGELGKGIEPGLILTPPAEATEDDDGFLALSEVARLDLNADWVVLSACNTAAGESTGDGAAAKEAEDPSREAEGLTGLAKAFSYAGAKALLVSHWSVSSDATVALMEHLFRGYREGQWSRAEAHRRAMLAMIATGDPLLSHPSFWAPFVVVGDGG